jgi:hypothetical protein
LLPLFQILTIFSCIATGATGIHGRNWFPDIATRLEAAVPQSLTATALPFWVIALDGVLIIIS